MDIGNSSPSIGGARESGVKTRRQRGSGIPQAESEAARGGGDGVRRATRRRRRATAAVRRLRPRAARTPVLDTRATSSSPRSKMPTVMGGLSSRWRPVLAATTRRLRTRAVVPRAVVVVSPRPALRRPRRRTLLRRRRCSPISTRVALTATSPHSRRLRRVGSTAGAPSRGCRSATNWAAVVPRRPVGSPRVGKQKPTV